MNKALILSLGRTGSLPEYAENISENFSLNYDILVSKNRINKKPLKNSIEITTYKNKFSFVINTFFYLPFILIKLLPKIKNNYNVLYIPYKHLWDIPFILAFKLLKKRIVFTVHDGILHTGEKTFFTQYLSNIRIKSSSELIFLTNYVKKTVEEKIKVYKPNYIVPHPVLDNEYFSLENRSISTKNLLFIGRIDRYKGIELLIDSAIEAESYFDELIIAGSVLYPLKIPKHPKIKLINKYLSDKEIGELLTWANVLVIPYTEATQSGIISLGIGANLPMICTNVGGLNEQLNKNECFWCEPNKNSLVNTIKEAFTNTHKNLKITKLLSNKKDSLSWETTTNSIEQILINNEAYYT
ncbi:glycosyltransferase involved in cell wall biosynthesis [Tenacibaculum adriaticum]|uniref:Glycosyltransferase involved in cell wall biosynthesis n=1 Tax=Tenacibaculum adriaticum TaxID=413713 RepID=A0A5S5DV76_9FLAO|nr:glycosyltransferase [Tenacibaculum adriaticum]TYP99900.1 glycosyltransferase involved in cell wall biosynthesis [Tenacibaculum adriaticum]